MGKYLRGPLCGGAGQLRGGRIEQDGISKGHIFDQGISEAARVVRGFGGARFPRSRHPIPAPPAIERRRSPKSSKRMDSTGYFFRRPYVILIRKPDKAAARGQFPYHIHVIGGKALLWSGGELDLSRMTLRKPGQKRHTEVC